MRQPPDNQARFAVEVWRFKRRERNTEPDPFEFGLTFSQGEGISRQCKIEFERKFERQQKKLWKQPQTKER